MIFMCTYKYPGMIFIVCVQASYSSKNISPTGYEYKEQEYLQLMYALYIIRRNNQRHKNPYIPHNLKHIEI